MEQFSLIIITHVYVADNYISVAEDAEVLSTLESAETITTDFTFATAITLCLVACTCTCSVAGWLIIQRRRNHRANIKRKKLQQGNLRFSLLIGINIAVG